MATSPGHAKLMDGESLARRIREQVRVSVDQIRAQSGIVPCLGTMLMGDDPASAVYVRMQQKRCESAGIKFLTTKLPSDTTTGRAVAEVDRLATDPGVHGILVQHPVPHQIDRRAVFERIPPAKDVDGITSTNLGRLILGIHALAPCTPKGIMRLIEEYRIAIRGADAVVIGRSPILGRPMASMLINAHATVTLCHSHTRNLPEICRRADILIAAVGKSRFVRGDWIKTGAAVIDAGYNADGAGDVDFEAAAERASFITPVPGGVGPMTLAILMEQSVRAAAQQLGVDLTPSNPH